MSKSLRVNSQIRSYQVMVVGADGAQLGVMSVEEALGHAADAEMDLVEVSPNATPPVCKIMDFGKFKYRQNKKSHDAKKKQKIIKLKEVKITPGTEEHDYQFKLSHARRFLGEGDKVKVAVFFRGREITHAELGLRILQRFEADLTEIAVVEQEAKQEGRNMLMIFAPKAGGESAARKAKPKTDDDDQMENSGDAGETE
ncbi:MAG: translation initiation factor IF-3 [Nitrospinae bacterium]|nr:translation initiation factor IF-3 [Nitrospinota bacterium]